MTDSLAWTRWLAVAVLVDDLRDSAMAMVEVDDANGHGRDRDTEYAYHYARDAILALAQSEHARGYRQGQRDMRERAAEVCEGWGFAGELGEATRGIHALPIEEET